MNEVKAFSPKENKKSSDLTHPHALSILSSFSSLLYTPKQWRLCCVPSSLTQLLTIIITHKTHTKTTKSITINYYYYYTILLQSQKDHGRRRHQLPHKNPFIT
jgi:hypothetical protein